MTATVDVNTAPPPHVASSGPKSRNVTFPAGEVPPVRIAVSEIDPPNVELPEACVVSPGVAFGEALGVGVTDGETDGVPDGVGVGLDVWVTVISTWSVSVFWLLASRESVTI